MKFIFKIHIIFISNVIYNFSTPYHHLILSHLFIQSYFTNKKKLNYTYDGQKLENSITSVINMILNILKAKISFSIKFGHKIEQI